MDGQGAIGISDFRVKKFLNLKMRWRVIIGKTRNVLRFTFCVFTERKHAIHRTEPYLCGVGVQQLFEYIQMLRAELSLEAQLYI